MAPREKCIGCGGKVGPDDVVVTKQGRWYACPECLNRCRSGWLKKEGK